MMIKRLFYLFVGIFSAIGVTSGIELEPLASHIDVSSPVEIYWTSLPSVSFNIQLISWFGTVEEVNATIESLENNRFKATFSLDVRVSQCGFRLLVENLITSNDTMSDSFCAINSNDPPESGCLPHYTVMTEQGYLSQDSEDSIDCVWNIFVPEGKQILFWILELETEEYYDYLYLDDGSGETKKYSGSMEPTLVHSCANHLEVGFHTDANSKNAGGFTAQFKSISGSKTCDDVDIPSTSESLLCSNTCEHQSDGVCDDGGSGSLFDVCTYGTDCSDCGPREEITEGDYVVYFAVGLACVVLTVLGAGIFKMYRDGWTFRGKKRVFPHVIYQRHLTTSLNSNSQRGSRMSSALPGVFLGHVVAANNNRRGSSLMSIPSMARSDVSYDTVSGFSVTNQQNQKPKYTEKLYRSVLSQNGSLTWEVCRNKQFQRPKRFHVSHEEWTRTRLSTDLAAKQRWLHRKLKRLHASIDDPPLVFHVSRSSVFEDTFNFFRELDHQDFYRNFRFKFLGEEGMDASGLSREWCFEVSRALFNADFGLFTFSHASELTMTYKINPQSALCVPEYKDYFKFVGRFVAKVIMEQYQTHGGLDDTVLRHITSTPHSYSDLPVQLERSLAVLMQPSTDVSDLDLEFTCTVDGLGGAKVIHPLVPDGANKPVTNENLQAYVDALIKFKFFTVIDEHLKAMMEGIYEIIPVGLLSVFTPPELRLLMSGQERISVDDWRAHTVYRGAFEELGANHEVVGWFWKCLRGFKQIQLSRILAFATGSPVPPAQGFSALQGNGSLCLFTIDSMSLDQSNPFPIAHTCFNRLDLPLYTCEQQLRTRFREIVEMEVVSFGLD